MIRANTGFSTQLQATKYPIPYIVGNEESAANKK
jgi:hypothetical protein